MSKIKILFLLFFLALLPNFSIGLKIFGPSNVFALEINYPKILGQSVNNTSKFPDFAAYFFNIGMFVAASLAALVILIGGAMWMISFSRGKIEQSGKDWVKSGALGLVLLLSSYIIAYTINPNFTVFGQEGLNWLSVPISLLTGQNTPTNSSQYSEIPVGTLTEDVLARQINCYDFDVNGEPIDGDPSTPNIIEPSLKDHDRLDCILKLADAIQRKAKIAGQLSDKIAGLMDTCRCTKEKCQLDCDVNDPSQCQYTGSCPGGWCTGKCVNTKCKAANNIDNTSCCEDNVKKQIEHGPITLPQESNCPGQTTPPANPPAPPAPPAGSVMTAPLNIFSKNIINGYQILGDIIPAAGSNVFLADETTPVTPPAPPKVSSISITPGDSQIAPAESQTYFVSAKDQYGNAFNNANIVLSGQSPITCNGSVCSSPDNTPDSTYTITAALAEDNSITATATLRVKELTVSISGSTWALAASQNPNFYIAQPQGGTGNYSISWSGDPCAGQNGTNCQALFPEPGGKTITVTVSDGQKSKTSEINVVAYTFVTAGCSVSAISVKPGDPVTFTANPGGGKAPYIFEWELPADASDCTEGNATSRTCTTSFSKEGTYTAKVTITYNGNGTYPNSADCTVNVSNAAGTPNNAIIKYNGLDEFRDGTAKDGSKYSDQNIIAEVEVPLPGSKYSASEWKTLLLNRIAYDDKVLVVDNNAWKKLPLIDKLKYLKEKMKLINLDGDLQNLKQAKDQMNNCYDVQPYIDYLKLITQTKKTDKIISSQDTYRDPISNAFISTEKYCNGYEYSNAKCFQTCQKTCGPINQTSLDKLAQCPSCTVQSANNCFSEWQNCNDSCMHTLSQCSQAASNETERKACIETAKKCQKDCSTQSDKCNQEAKNDSAYIDCLNTQKTCVQDAINNATCSGGGGNNFQDCMVNCNKDCNDECSKKYPACSDDLKKCQERCNSDSTSLIKQDTESGNFYPINEDKCYFSFDSLQKCATVKYCTGTNQKCTSDNDCFIEMGETCDPVFNDFATCANNSYLCKYASDQQPGYPDCLKNPTPTSNYSSFYLYTNLNKQKYISCTGPATNSPDFWRCPTCSKCPECPIVNSDNASAVDPNNLVKIVGSPDFLDKSLLVSTGQCNEFSYNDDPLTFYCRLDWEKSPAYSGYNWTCPANNEIPIGQTVDDTIIWAQKIANAMNDFITKTESLINYVNIYISNEKGYCQCNSTCGVNGWGVDEKTCGGDCIPKEIPPGQTDQGGGNDGSSPDSNDPGVPPDWDGGSWDNGDFIPSDPLPTDYLYPSKIKLASQDSGGTTDTGDTGGTGDAGGSTGDGGGEAPPQWTCSCVLQQCQGGSCQKMINALRGKLWDQSCPLGMYRCGISCFYSSSMGSNCSEKCSGWETGIKESFQALKDIIEDDQTAQSRSEILKKLIYSRKKLNDCSGTLSEFGSGAATPMDCTRASEEAQILKNGCYGVTAGEIMKPPQTNMDNWFCCQSGGG